MNHNFDQRAFRNAMGCYATGVAVITTRSADEADVGVTVNSFASLSLDPPLILFSIAKTANVLNSLSTCKNFGVNILSERQRPLSNMFAKPSTAVFTPGSFRRGASGVALFDGALTNLDCRNAQQIDGGDHIIFVGQVEHITVTPEHEPLLFYRGAYGFYHKETTATSSPQVVSNTGSVQVACA